MPSPSPASTLYAANGGDNALAEIDLESGHVKGYRPAGYFPTAIALSPDASTAYLLNTKGNGSVSRTLEGRPGNAHDFQGTVTVLDLAADIQQTTETVARNNHWRIRRDKPCSPRLLRRYPARYLHHQGKPHLRRNLRRPPPGQWRSRPL